MAEDIVNRLRSWAGAWGKDGPFSWRIIALEVADEIERLRAENTIKWNRWTETEPAMGEVVLAWGKDGFSEKFFFSVVQRHIYGVAPVGVSGYDYDFDLEKPEYWTELPEAPEPDHG